MYIKIVSEFQRSYESPTVYLERIAKIEEERSCSNSTTKVMIVIEDLKERIELNNKTKDRNVYWGQLIIKVDFHCLGIY